MRNLSIHRCKLNLENKKGFTLVETLIGVFIFMIIAVTFYRAFGVVMDGVRVLRTKNTAANLANEQFEIVRNMPYDNIGIIGGLPNGVIPNVQILNRDGIDFEVTTIVRSIDLPQDGTIGGSPNDSSPADQKLVELEIGCEGCGLSESLVFSTNVSPKNLESTGNNGALFITVIDSNGAPVSDADVSVNTTYGTTSISVNDTTGTSGMLQLVDVPPLVNGYRISVSKDGYSSEQTVSTSTPGKPDATVATGQVTNITFIIDKTANLRITSRDISCSLVSGFDFNLEGSKMTGAVPKYSVDHITSGGGTVNLFGLEWDTYTVTGIDGTKMIIGTNPVTPFSLNPDSDVNLDLIVANKDLPALHVSVVDPSGLPISGALVSVDFDSGSDQSAETGRGSTTQTDWSGGGGQEEIGDMGSYYASNGNITVLSPAGQLSLTGAPPSYSSSGYLESSTFDLGTTTEFHNISWLPESQLSETGAGSVRFQIASNIEVTPTSTWDFVGPNGSAGSYYETSGDSISSAHDGSQYLRYRIFLSTASTSFTPTVSDVSFTYTTGCVPPGQVLFDNISVGDATITVTKPGYNTSIIDVTLTSGWQTKQIVLSPI